MFPNELELLINTVKVLGFGKAGANFFATVLLTERSGPKV